MTCTPMSSPTRRAAAAPASVAAFTEPTSPRTIAVTSPASTFCQPTKTTFAVFTIASAASIMPTRPRVSTMPSASPISAFALSVFSAIGLLDSTPGGDGKRLNNIVALDDPDDLHQIRDDAGVIRENAHAIAGLEPRRAADSYRRVLLG